MIVKTLTALTVIAALVFACGEDKKDKKDAAASIAELQSVSPADLACAETSACAATMKFDGCTPVCEDYVALPKARAEQLAVAILTGCGAGSIFACGLKANSYAALCKAGTCALAPVRDQKVIDAQTAEKAKWKAEGGAKFKAGARFYAGDFTLDATRFETCVAKDPAAAGASWSGKPEEAKPVLVTFADEACDFTQGYVKAEDYDKEAHALKKGATVYRQKVKADAPPTCTLTAEYVDRYAYRQDELIELNLSTADKPAGCESVVAGQNSGFIPAADLL